MDQPLNAALTLLLLSFTARQGHITKVRETALFSAALSLLAAAERVDSSLDDHGVASRLELSLPTRLNAISFFCK